MCKRIEELVANQFRNFTGVVVKDENQLLNLEVFPQKREPFKQLLRNVLPNLRLRSSYGLVTVADFAGYVEKEEDKRTAFFQKGLEIARQMTGNNALTLEDDLYAELRPREEHHGTNAYLSEQCRYFVQANKVYTAWANGLKGRHWAYYPPVSALEKCRKLRDMIDLYYRRGKF